MMIPLIGWRTLLLILCVCWCPLASAAAATLAEAAREQIGVTTSYDPAYRKLTYPGGDVPKETGVCSDVVVRAFRAALKFDLQKAVHEDMTKAFDQYPRDWGLKRPDRNIDHRRVPNLMTYFKRQGWELRVSTDATQFKPGDVVAWNLGGGINHIGIISDRRSPEGTPLVIHNIGQGAKEEDILFSYKIIGHYRRR
jgi:uncharacterized protein YijF (DUF1287 family)